MSYVNTIYVSKCAYNYDNAESEYSSMFPVKLNLINPKLSGLSVVCLKANFAIIATGVKLLNVPAFMHMILPEFFS